MKDALEDMEPWIRKHAIKWVVAESLVRARVYMALKHKREIADLCGVGSTSVKWIFEEYFRDLYPQVESKSVDFDELEARAKVDAAAYRDRNAVRRVLEAVRKKLGL